MLAPPLLDRLGIGLSVLCLVHCLVLPVALAGLSVWAAVSEPVHLALALVLVPVAALAGVRGYRRHRRPLVALLLAAGAALLIGALAMEEAAGEWGHLALTVAGGGVLVSAHVLNWRWGASCDPFPRGKRARVTAPRRV